MFFSTKINTNSECQFKSDFGEYPPKPLSRMKVNTQFDILSKGRVGLLFKSFSRVFSMVFLLMAGKPLLSSSSPPMIFIKNGIVQMRKEVLKIKTNATHLKKSPFQVKFVLFVLGLIAGSPLLLLLFVYHLIRLCIRLLIMAAVSSGHDDNLGYFVKLPHTSSEIIINTSALRRLKNSAQKIQRTISFETIVSHEHIHLLQNYYFAERINKYEVENEKVNLLKSLLKDPEKNFGLLSYFFKIDEMEARLHEVVLSYYRKNGELPLDENGFLRLLLASRSEAMNSLRTKLGGKDGPYFKSLMYDVRCEAEEKEIIDAIFYLTDPWTYILKVLPVMYGNLLILYGDTNRAKKYFETISSFELYNKLYGEIIIPA